ncbi:MAG: DUF4093 domain-containing protein [Oscillospiraceae bacterium]|jgi:ribonuclease M5|nr:DUF4093 domain-containing protein [Oscillospiraceae bacterium]
MDKVRVREVIVVEGKYDLNTLKQVLDATVITTEGFGIFHQKDKLDLIVRMAQSRGVIILTDSDGAGFVIRNHLKGCLDPDLVKHAYIPDIPGKERRKARASKEGKLGVEGMPPEVLLEALRRAGATLDDVSQDAGGRITKADLYALGLSGRPDSAQRRKELLQRLELPEKLSPNAMLDVLNVIVSKEELFSMYR